MDESVWFDQFYHSVVCPIFFVETLADLAKEMRGDRSAEKEVEKIAQKFPDMGGNPCMFHAELCLGNLMGQPVPMDGRIIMPAARPVRAGNRSGFVFESPPEAEAFNRWQRQEFKEVERNHAREWRAMLSSLDLKEVAKKFGRTGIAPTSCKNLKDAYSLAESIVSSPKPYDQMALATLFLGVPREYEQEMVRRWQMAGLSPISQYAPYAAFVLKIEIFFQVAISASLISADRSSNRVDIAYLYYLPFSMVFVSSDKLHRNCAPFFLRENQEFVWGPDLKADLKSLDERYQALPQATKDLGVLAFASTPPQDESCLTSDLWDRHMSKAWRDRPEINSALPNSTKTLVDEMNAFNHAEALEPPEVNFDAESADAMSLQRMVRRQKGRWLQVPKGLKDEDTDDDGS
ncbi:hypothetical protein [Thioalkalivibrio thiocyanodenitrificans]|uniref:hypothetical protein n=1 Tax=Thioalkalivibrio thiocyanodenitrificans TaxID=243063 RepID=UPI000476ABA7|nr:hypothetical protein [Thioalkalivibrio thiocyanodenitrificans]